MPESDPGTSARFVSPKGEILPLTGLRIVAALWVVVFHVGGNIHTEWPALGHVLSPILAHGDLGVDLFYALSGFVLTLNYADRIGRRLSRALTANFIWARLSRVWPVFFVTLCIAGAWHGALIAAHSHDPVAVRDFSALSFLRQFTLTVLWTSADNNRLTWDGPAWSVSAEWLAYLLFPIIALLLIRLARVATARQLLVFGLFAVFPVVLFGIVGKGLYGTSYMWLLRILGEFLAGSFACLAARRIVRTARVGRIASWWSALLILATIGILYGSHLVKHPQLSVLVVPLFAPLLLALSLADGGIARTLSTKAFVLGGHFSYSVYLVHMLMVEPIWWAQSEWPGVLGDGRPMFDVLLALVPVFACVGGYCMWRWVEEPARRTMRAMVNLRPAAANGATPDAPVASADGQRETAPPLSHQRATEPV
ncbi:MAG TPA: acyltransferase [Pseudonocardiaceae bacterium]|jgi:peptidoglycan/LPS O-acetylase OafA/YrhL|nr:acyltransferase [Pseudonocardiaceae bacterium]